MSGTACTCGSDACGCCGGVAVLTPAATTNRPGLDALQTRIGTHGSFLASMQARLSTHRLANGARPLADLRVRSADDPAIALLDAWATAADVLTFYQQRIANEGYLRTATERVSLYWLARLVGYAPRPGVAASVYLSFTIDPPPLPPPGTAPQPADTLIPKGARVQTVAGQDELPQSFETSDDLRARAAWNRLGVRQTEPQQLRTVERDRALWLAGTQTRLKPGDPLLIGMSPFGAPVSTDPPPDAWRILTVAEDSSAGRTRVTLEPWLAAAPASAASAGQAHATGAATLAALAAAPSRPLANALQLPRDLGRSFDVSGDAALQVMTTATPRLAATLGAALAGDTTASPPATLRVFAPRLRAGLFGSRVPRRSRTRLTPVMSGEFSTGQFTSETVDVGEWPIVERDPDQIEGPLIVKRHESDRQLWLDAAYDGVTADSWLLVDATAVPPVPDAGGRRQSMVAPARPVLVARIAAVQPKVSRSDYGLVADTSGVTLGGGDRWLSLDDNQDDLALLLKQSVWNSDFQVIRNTTVYARSEELTLAEAPLTDDVCGRGDPLELDGLYLDFAPGRFVIVSGERADLDGIEGVFASEPAMVADIVHDVAGDLVDAQTGRVRRLPLQPPMPRWRGPIASGKATVFALAGDRIHSFVTLEKPLSYCYRRGTVRIDGNVVKATHGESRHETLGSGDGTKALQRFALKQAPVTWLAAPTAAGAASTVQLFVDDVRWHAVTSFLDAGPRDRVYVERVDATGVTSVVFGNGVAGARLPTGTGNVVADYRSGIGRPGDVKARQISQLVTRPLGVREVVNPLPSAGGADPEGSADIRRNAPLAVTALGRLVSTRDYADFARTFAGIGKAAAVRLSDGHGEVVLVTVAGSDDIPLDGSDLIVNLRRAFADLGDPFQPLRLLPRELLLLIVAAKIRIDPDHLWERVVADVRSALLDAFGFDRRDLGQGAASSEVLGVVQAVPGVVYVDLDAFGAIPTLDYTGSDAGVPRPPEQIAKDVAAVVAAGVAPTVAAAGGRRVGMLRPAQLLVLAGSVPATLVLNQIV